VENFGLDIIALNRFDELKIVISRK